MQSKNPIRWLSLTWLSILAFAIAAAGAAALFLTSLKKNLLIGCAGANPCVTLSQSRWGYWAYFPVSLFGLILYLLILAGLLWAHCRGKAKSVRLLNLIWAGALAATGSALWFLGLEVFVFGKICVYCTTCHLSTLIGTVSLYANQELHPAGSIASFRRQFLVSGAAVFLLIAGQIWGPIPQSQLAVQATPTTQPTPEKPVPIPEELVFAGERVQLKRGEYPLIGPKEATQVVALLFDYTCGSCRASHPHVLGAISKTSSPVAVVMIPVPLNPACNPAITRLLPEHENACVLAQYALAVWKANPDKFAEFDKFLMGDGPAAPSPASAKERAEELVGKEAFDYALQSPELAEAIRKTSQIYRASEGGALPKILTKGLMTSGEVNSIQQVLDLLKPQQSTSNQE